MKKRHVLVIGLVILCMGAALLFNRCSGENITKVTISLKQINQSYYSEKESWIDRISSLFIKRLYAQVAWDSVVDDLVIMVEGDGMDTIEAYVPPTTTSYTVEVPSGSARIFTVYGINAGQGKNHGGIAVADLPAGSDINLPIYMIPLPTGINIGLSVGAPGIQLTWYDPPNILGYYIYRSTNSGGPYTRIATVNVPTQTSYLDPDANLEINTWYYYCISTYNANGESPKTDEKAQLYPIIP